MPAKRGGRRRSYGVRKLKIGNVLFDSILQPTIEEESSSFAGKQTKQGIAARTRGARKGRAKAQKENVKPSLQSDDDSTNDAEADGDFPAKEKTRRRRRALKENFDIDKEMAKAKVPDFDSIDKFSLCIESADSSLAGRGKWPRSYHSDSSEINRGAEREEPRKDSSVDSLPLSMRRIVTRQSARNNLPIPTMSDRFRRSLAPLPPLHNIPGGLAHGGFTVSTPNNNINNRRDRLSTIETEGESEVNISAIDRSSPFEGFVLTPDGHFSDGLPQLSASFTNQRSPYIVVSAADQKSQGGSFEMVAANFGQPSLLGQSQVNRSQSESDMPAASPLAATQTPDFLSSRCADAVDSIVLHQKRFGRYASCSNLAEISTTQDFRRSFCLRSRYISASDAPNSNSTEPLRGAEAVVLSPRLANSIDVHLLSYQDADAARENEGECISVASDDDDEAMESHHAPEDRSKNRAEQRDVSMMSSEGVRENSLAETPEPDEPMQSYVASPVLFADSPSRIEQSRLFESAQNATGSFQLVVSALQREMDVGKMPEKSLANATDQLVEESIEKLSKMSFNASSLPVDSEEEEELESESSEQGDQTNELEESNAKNERVRVSSFLQPSFDQPHVPVNNLSLVSQASVRTAAGGGLKPSQKVYTPQVKIVQPGLLGAPNDSCSTIGDSLMSNFLEVARQKVFEACDQTEPVLFSACLSPRALANITKIGEGVYGEVFKAKPLPNSTDSPVYKILPIEGDFDVNDEPQKLFAQILPELIIARELSLLRSAKLNRTPNFVDVKRIFCVQGAYPRELLAAWDAYDEACDSENDRPDMFGEEQLFIVFQFGDGGIDLERAQLKNAQQAESIARQIGLALHIAERALQFEHRDLHIGNVLIKETLDENIEYLIDGHSRRVKSHGVQVFIIDFTFSRICKGDMVIFTDLSNDETLFLGSSDYQFEIYRMMRTALANSWDSFKPKTNVFWFHYLLDKLLNFKQYSKRKINVRQAGKLRDVYVQVTAAISGGKRPASGDPLESMCDIIETMDFFDIY